MTILHYRSEKEDQAACCGETLKGIYRTSHPGLVTSDDCLALMAEPATEDRSAVVVTEEPTGECAESD